MRFFMLLAIALATTSCGHWSRTPPRKEFQHDANSAEMTRLVITYAAELAHTRHLELENSIVCFDTKIKKLRLDFSSQNIPELCDARGELVDVVDGYLKRINTHGVLKYELDHYPFTEYDLEVHITYDSDFIRYVDPTYISASLLEDGTAFFYNGELEEPFSDIWSQKVEPYTKTRQIVYFGREAEKPIIEAIEEQKRETVLKEERFVN